MYYYVYDEFIQDPKFERELALVETRLTDLGINGKIARLALFRDASELIRDEVARGAKTIVAVGNDLTFRKVIDAVAGANVALGVIPLGNSMNHISELLGVPVGVAACDVLSARILERVDIGMMNGKRFLHSVNVSFDGGVRFSVDNFVLQAPGKGSIEVRNLTSPDAETPPSNPTDGKLEFVMKLEQRSLLRKRVKAPSFLPFSSGRLQFASEQDLLIDGHQHKTAEIDFSVLSGRLQIVTGKSRAF